MKSNTYDDMLYMSHHVSKHHRPMTMENRAAQFSPFAALTGYEEAIIETGRTTSEKIELEEDEKLRLNEKLGVLQEYEKQHPFLTVTYFQSDDKKSGGTYITASNQLKKIDAYENCLILMDQTKIEISNIIRMECELFVTWD